MDTAMITKKKQTLGKRKIEIKKISERSALQATFSKRRDGLLNKASELCLLTGSEAAVIIFSPTNRAFAFGHPSINTVTNRFLTAIPHVDLYPTGVEESKKMYMDAMSELEKTKIMKTKCEGFGEGFWWDVRDIEEMEIDELEQYIASIEGLKKNVANRVRELEINNSPSRFLILDNWV